MTRRASTASGARQRPAWLTDGQPTDLFDKHQIAAWFNKTPAAVEKWLARGLIDSIMVGGSRRAMRCDIAAYYEHLWKTTTVNPPEVLAS